MKTYPVTVATRGATIETTVTASVLATADAVIDQARREAGISPAAFAYGVLGHEPISATGPARAVADGGHPARPVRVPVEASTGECWHVPGGCAGHNVKTIAATASELVDDRGLRPCQANGCQAAGIKAPVRCDGCGVAVFDPETRGAARYCPECRAYVDAHPDERDHEVYALREPDAPVPVTDGGAVRPATTKAVTISGDQVPRKLAALAGDGGFDAAELRLVGADASVTVRVVDGTLQVTEGDT